MLDSSVEEIKSKLSIEEVVGGYLQLQRAGRNLKACCPFHNEKTPSFMVSPERQSWHCFGCNEGGDIFSFVMKMEGVEFPEALRLLADKAGVTLRQAEHGERGEKGRLLALLDLSKRFYRECLKIKGGKAAYEYLRGRGLSEEMIDKFELGYAPDSWQLLSDYLKRKGFTEREILAAGMSVKNERGKVYDRFRGRIMFPVNTVAGQTVGFSSRVMPGGDETSAKYINTPETSVYNKGRILYGLDKAKIFLRQKDQCIMVEGNVDVIASYQAGVNNVVATSGTALTPDQLRIIKRYTDHIVFSFDMDGAGVKAAERGIEMALAEGMQVSVIRVPQGKDPADAVQSDPESWRRAAASPIKVMDFYFESVMAKYDWREVEGKKLIARELLRVIAKIANNIERSFYLNKLSYAIGEIGIEEKELWEAMQAARRDQAGPTRAPARGPAPGGKARKADRQYKLEESLIALVALQPARFEQLSAGLGEIFEDKDFKDIYSEIEKCQKETGSLRREDLEQIKRRLADKPSCREGSKSLADVLDAALFGIESHLEEEELDLVEEAEKCILDLRELIVRKRLKRIEMRIKEADRRQDGRALEELAREQIALLAQLQEPGA